MLTIALHSKPFKAEAFGTALTPMLNDCFFPVSLSTPGSL